MTTVLNPDSYITMFADASYCNRTLAYGWGVWVKYTDAAGVVRSVYGAGGGVGIKSSSDAEVEALRQGLYAVERLGVNVTRGKKIVVQSDCTSAISTVKEEFAEYKARVEAASVYAKHVYGHQGYKTPRNAVNTMCDRHARHAMRKFRNQVDGK